MARKEGARPRKQWDPQTKANIVIQGIKGRAVSELCCEYGIAQSEYYRRREQFLQGMPLVFGDNKKREQSLVRENDRLKRIIGDMTLELKKLNEWPE